LDKRGNDDVNAGFSAKNGVLYKQLKNADLLNFINHPSYFLPGYIVYKLSQDYVTCDQSNSNLMTNPVTTEQITTYPITTVQITTYPITTNTIATNPKANNPETTNPINIYPITKINPSVTSANSTTKSAASTTKLKITNYFLFCFGIIFFSNDFKYLSNLVDYSTNYEIDGNFFEFKFKFNMKFTMVDGKVVSAVLSVSSAQACNVCRANPKEMND
jgi:hypothetical protein